MERRHAAILLIGALICLGEPAGARAEPDPPGADDSPWAEWGRTGGEWLDGILRFLGGEEPPDTPDPGAEEGLRTLQLEERLRRMEERLTVLEAGHEIRLTMMEGLVTAAVANPPPRLEGGLVQVGGGGQIWQLEELLSLRRVLDTPVTFAHPFPAPPQVLVGVAGIREEGVGQNFRVAATRITRQGFVARVESHGESRPRELTLLWLAYGAEHPNPVHPPAAGPTPPATGPAR